MLSAIAHQYDENRDRIFNAFLTINARLLNDPETDTADRAKMYVDLVISALSDAARSSMEGLMTTTPHREYYSETFRRLVAQGREEGIEEGIATGAIQTLESVLEARGIKMSPEARARIEACTDVEQLTAWARRAVTANDVTELFD
ncbi:hypothetical protein AB0N05_07945 [Nocardia sp. NPDC051030]|uniref:hypothetical protein n=1 Tax=Nocardia sp. NPDC051030 TaxID=3155162 RepID=UPI003438F06A